MRMVELIQKKRDGVELSAEEIKFIVQGYTEGKIPDYQVSAWAMAIFYQGMTARETSQLTMAMAESGDQLSLVLPGQIFVDKHSSGGVGDKTTLVVAPAVAACGVPIAKMSGRGLGHTGGTIDKLSAIAGFQVELTEEQFLRQIQRIGISIIAQTGNMVPADKKLYALRDVTATVDSIPLIASSIMSKKIAAGAQALVLDVKYGSGAFMASEQEAKTLAKTMVEIGKNLSRDTVAVLSDMDQPLGKAVGNSIEILEVIDTLRGQGPSDLLELSLELGSWMLVLGKKAENLLEARETLQRVLEDGSAWNKFLEFIAAQGGDLLSVQNRNLPLAPIMGEYKAAQAGTIQKIDAKAIGISSMILGAGRETKDSIIDLGAGIYLNKKIGDRVQEGEAILRLYTSSDTKMQKAMKIVQAAVVIGNEEAFPPKLVATVIV